MSFVVVENVGKVYRASGGGAETRVLGGVSFSVAEGQFVALMGPSGSGKTSLLTVVGAMNHPTEGRVVVDGIDVYALAEERRADFRREYLGFVFQQHHLMPYLTAVENVMLPLATVAAPAREKRARAQASLEKVGLGSKSARLPNQLSGGEQGRLAIARAVVNEPPLLLADEPTGALDTRTGEEVLGVLHDLNARGQTVLLVTHNPEAAARAGRVLHMRDGMLEGETAAGPRPGTPPKEVLITASS
ncbi:MAG TPA: ABC transporter ATP-binding protein [Pyrinomonadaceae bacterium]|jgi:putative ABC transport system ATP-binding protein